MRHDVADHPAASQVLEAVHRSFTKPRKQGFTSTLLQSVKEFEMHSQAGLYLGHGASHDVDLDRLCRVVERTTLGPYFHEFGGRLPASHHSVVYANRRQKRVPTLGEYLESEPVKKQNSPTSSAGQEGTA